MARGTRRFGTVEKRLSAPHITGVYALIKQQNPDWTPAMAKSAIMTTARQSVVEQDGTTPADPFDFGAGHVAPGSTGPGSIFDPGLVYDAGINDYVAFICGADPSVIAQPVKTCARLVAGGFSTDASDLNQPSIAVAELAGSQTVTRTVTSVATAPGAVTYTPTVDAPAGFDVSVSPAELTLRPGASRTFTVTITNAVGNTSANGSMPSSQLRFTVICPNNSGGYCNNGIWAYDGPSQQTANGIVALPIGASYVAECHVNGNQSVNATPWGGKNSIVWVRFTRNGNTLYFPWAWASLDGGDNFNMIPGTPC